MYYFLMAIVDIFFYLAENWQQLTVNALFGAIGIILGKRLGSRIVIKQMMKMLGLEKKSKLERKVDWLIEMEWRRGNIWSAEHGKSEIPIAGQQSHFLWTMKSLVQRAGLSIPQLKTGKSILLRRMRRMNKKFTSRKFWMAVISGLLVILNDGLDLGLDTNTVLAFAGIVMSFIFGEAYVDSKRTGGQINEKHIDSSEFEG